MRPTIERFDSLASTLGFWGWVCKSTLGRMTLVFYSSNGIHVGNIYWRHFCDFVLCCIVLFLCDIIL